MPKVNPFKPMSPVQPGMFAGRLEEIERLESALIQTQHGNPTNFMIVGERGIGKSSLLFFIKGVAEGQIDINESKVKFLVIDTDLDESTTPLCLMKKIELGMRQTLANTEKARTFFRNAWGFLQRVEAGGISIKQEEKQPSEEITIEEFAYTLSDTIKRICDTNYFDQELFSVRYDGVLILIDEADNASKGLRLGSFLKLLTERLQRRGCNRVAIGLAGLTELRGILAASHLSSLRLFDEIELNRLHQDDVRYVIDRGLKIATEENKQEFKITEEAITLLVSLSEGFPHFIQQFCYSAFSADSDYLIDESDVLSGAMGKNGAIELIGNRYYREAYYHKIKRDSYRQVLRIMADHLDAWVTKDQIREKFKGNSSTLDNAIHALRDRKIIIPKEGERGVYRLQHKGFALWIKLYTSRQSELALPS